ncbi:MAG TPA: glycosyltransferase [Acidimicrobiales bacterium]|nr:glycosyltransferase [Acidimicrobiales bacterium]
MTAPADLTVVVPTRRRWQTMWRTLAALGAQTVSGFELVIVVDGEDDPCPFESELPSFARLLVVPHGGPGLARNRGAAATDRPLLLFLGDDIVPAPDLVEAHLAAHGRRPADDDAVLGLVVWHPEAAAGRIQRWLEWSGTQFDYRSMTGPGEAGFGRFYSSNVSLKRTLFDAAGGFDPAFAYYYEDLDAGWRLARKGMRLWFEPDAVGHHLHRYDWPSLRRRFEGIARGERLMADRHEWFEPFFAGRVRRAAAAGPVSTAWPLVVDQVPEGPLRRPAEDRANHWYLWQLAPFFENAWAAEGDLDELRRYLGDDFDPDLLTGHKHAVDEEAAAAATERDFYRTSRNYLYDLTAFASWPTKVAYRWDLTRVVGPGARLLDYGCGIGSDGLRLVDAGYRVDFADFDNPGTRYLRWRLQERRLDASVFDVEGEVPGGYDAVFAFDVIEHVDDPEDFLGRLEARGRLVAVNILEDDPTDTGLHHDLPVRRLLARAARRGIVRYRFHHGRSHLVIYRGDGGPSVGPTRSAVRLAEGRLLSTARLARRSPLAAGGALWRD